MVPLEADLKHCCLGASFLIRDIEVKGRYELVCANLTPGGGGDHKSVEVSEPLISLIRQLKPSEISHNDT